MPPDPATLTTKPASAAGRHGTLSYALGDSARRIASTDSRRRDAAACIRATATLSVRKLGSVSFGEGWFSTLKDFEGGAKARVLALAIMMSFVPMGWLNAQGVGAREPIIGLPCEGCEAVFD